MTSMAYATLEQLVRPANRLSVDGPAARTLCGAFLALFACMLDEEASLQGKQYMRKMSVDNLSGLGIPRSSAGESDAPDPIPNGIKPSPLSASPRHCPIAVCPDPTETVQAIASISEADEDAFTS